MRQILSIKDGVKINLLEPELSSQLYRLAHLWCAIFPLDRDGLTVTSGYEGHPSDGVHRPDSLHYKRRAIDLRTRDVDAARVKEYFCPMAAKLLGSDFDVVLESNHVHIEYDPKGEPHGNPA